MESTKMKKLMQMSILIMNNSLPIRNGKKHLVNNFLVLILSISFTHQEQQEHQKVFVVIKEALVLA